jgi:integrase
VVNPRQARALLAAVRAQQLSGPRLVAFFGLMYYAGLRPEEAVSLTVDCLTLPLPEQANDWGELHLRNATPDTVPATGRDWHSDPHFTATSRAQPHKRPSAKIEKMRRIRRSQRMTGALSKWGGWGSNPRPADYESAALTS